MKIRPVLSFPVALALLPGLALAQAKSTPAPATPAAAAAAPVSLPVTVVDDHGNPVKNLTADKVTLTDHGKAQTIQSFSVAQPQPLVIGILAQTSTGLRTEIGDIRLASTHFVDHTIPGSDNKFFVIQFAREVDLLEDPTATINKLHDAITQIGAASFGNQSSDEQSSGDHRAHSNGAALYDAIYLACTEVLKQQPGRHILIVVTDGVDRGSKVSMSDAIEAAQKSNTMVFSIYYKPEAERTLPERNNGNRRGGIGFPGGGGGYPGGGGGYPGGGRRGGEEEPQRSQVDGEKILEQLGNQTGGYKVVGKRDKAEESYNKLAALLKYQYTLTWAPDKDSASSDHHLAMTAKDKDIYPIVQENYSAQP